MGLGLIVAMSSFILERDGVCVFDILRFGDLSQNILELYYTPSTVIQI